jgi:cysteine-rich repeat protein
VCNASVCGDGIVAVGDEQCDTGGQTDACNADCTIPICGDGHLDPFLGEECDDGNLTSGDGCTGTCRSEPILCTPGATQCSGAQIRTCLPDGTLGPAAPCAGPTSCTFGVCL